MLRVIIMRRDLGKRFRDTERIVVRNIDASIRADIEKERERDELERKKSIEDSAERLRRRISVHNPAFNSIRQTMMLRGEKKQ